ncbi:MAG: 30S ribosomal protein S13 [Patescibacteria group bacterium]
MARIAGVTIPTNKQVSIALTYIYGIGDTRAAQICEKAGVAKTVRVKDLSEEQVNKVRDLVEKGFRVEGELRRDVQAHIKRLKEIGSYRGTRHMKRLPARGQRSKTNSRTVRGNVRKTMRSGRRILTKT